MANFAQRARVDPTTYGKSLIVSCAIFKHRTSHADGCYHYLTHKAGQFKRTRTMTDNVTLAPNILQPAAALKAYAPICIKFWENQETALAGLKEFADGWFARRHKGMQAALEAAKHIGDAETPTDILREYQNWLTQEMELVAEDGKAYREQVLR